MRAKHFKLLIFWVSFLPIYAQIGPGHVPGTVSWVVGNDSSVVVANRLSIDLLDTNLVLDSSLSVESEHYTIFIIVCPDSMAVDPVPFARLGRFELHNNGVWLDGRFTPIDFSDGQTKIIAVSGKRNRPIFGGLQQADYRLFNPSLFKLAEVLFYDRVLDSLEVRKVTSYLAVKHAVPMARGNQNFSYFLKGSKGKYWNEAVSRIYNHNLMALGHSKNELLYLTQSSTQNDSFKIALDTLVKDGFQRKVGVNDEAFIIFSQARKKFRKYIKCESANGPWNPIFYWKFELQDWYSQANDLLIQVEGPFLTVDTILLTSGAFNLQLSSILDSSHNRIYRIPIADLPNNKHYFFKTSLKDPCPSRLNIVATDSLGGIGLELGNASDSIASIELINLATGLITNLSVFEFQTGGIQLSHGNYLVNGLNENDEYLYSEPITLPLSQASNSQVMVQKSISVFPKPCNPSSLLTLQAEGLSSSYVVSLTDMNGRVLYLKRFTEASSNLELQIETPAVSGIYKVSIQEEDRSSSYLVPVQY